MRVRFSFDENQHQFLNFQNIGNDSYHAPGRVVKGTARHLTVLYQYRF